VNSYFNLGISGKISDTESIATSFDVSICCLGNVWRPSINPGTKTDYSSFQRFQTCSVWLCKELWNGNFFFKVIYSM